MEIMWPLIIFTFFLCLASGTFMWQGILTVQGKGKEMQLVSLIASLVCFGIGGLGVLFHLASPLRIFNGFGHITSGITQEVIAMVIVCLAIVVFFLMWWRDENHEAPKWCGVMAIITSILMIVVMAHSYWMASVPVWNNIVYILFFLANMLAAGILSSSVIARFTKCEDGAEFLKKYAFWLVVIYAVIVVVYAIYLVVLGNTSFSEVGFYFDPTLPDVHVTEADKTMAGIFTGSYAPLFWLGVVVIGLIAPLALAFVATKGAGKPAAAGDAAKAGILSNEKVAYLAALICLLIGGACWRVILYATALHVFAIF